MKVLLISQDFWPLKGGISSYLTGIYEKYFSKTQFEAIIPLSIKPCVNSRKFKVHRMEFAPFELDTKKRRECNKEILKKVGEIKPDILLFGYLRSHPEIGEFYKKINSNSLFGIFLHGKEAFIDQTQTRQNNIRGMQKGYTMKETEFYKAILNSADILFSVSDFTKKLIKKQGINRKIIKVYPSLDIKKIYSKSYAKNKLIKRKGHLKVIKIMPSLIKEMPNLRYLIVGKGLERKRLEKEIKRRNLDKFIKICSSVNNSRLPLFYSACDVFVLPCSHLATNDVEGFGIVFLEANVYRKPVIGTRTGGIPEAIVNNKTGYVINPHNLQELKRKILKLLKEPYLRKKMGERGRKRVAAQFSTQPSNRLIELCDVLPALKCGAS